MAKFWILDYDLADEDGYRPWFCHAATRNDARSYLANENNMPYLAARVYRQPAGDDISITMKNGLYLGIYHWVECHACSRQVYGPAHNGEDINTLYSYDANGEVTGAVVDWRDRVYCSDDCAASSGRPVSAG